MFAEDSLSHYLKSSGSSFQNHETVCKQLTEVLNKYRFKTLFDTSSKTVLTYGELLFESGSLQYSVPITMDIPPEFPELLPIVRTTLLHSPPSLLINSDGSFNYVPLIHDQPPSLVQIIDLILSQIVFLPPSYIPFSPLNQPPTQNILIFNKTKIEPIKQANPINPMDPINPNNVPTLPKIKPIIKPKKPLVTPNPTKTIIITKSIETGFNDIDLYLDKIDSEKELEGLTQLLTNGDITQNDFNSLKQNINEYPTLPEPPTQYLDLLELYKTGVVGRKELKANIPAPSAKPKISIENIKQLDEIQRSLAEMFLGGEIDEEEMNSLNLNYRKYLGLDN